ncbi:hypothetical protein GW933_01765 [Candidatus Falkowbacteria bacterium]|uniref:Uncharacterized protein n=1 Tax=Candidatus Buchananbacteria bacterium CG10_big_fil_rev_8_21_14_0_10_33_19 TaxID=1974525 RepID=A0A2H0W3Q1_9BACT|nr:hypothetical protein [Candidatus Falkowbacteria bacterium]PIS05976.1 MAG: hypothetical protein COT80_04380 [Candidatus Buchananbacteria bacterium CG10_big_fil_rev_8_21_14_0_10_33_19]
MLQTSQDFLNLSIAFIVIFIGLAIGWGCIYIALILRDIKKMTVSARKKLDLIDQILEIVKKKVETTASYLPPLIEGMSKLAVHFKEKKNEKKAKRKK